MEKSSLQRATIGVVGVIFVVAVTLGLLRGEVLSEQAGTNGQEKHETLNAQAVNQGALLFQKMGCAHCHAVDSDQKGIGPGLKGLFKRKDNLANGRPATEKNVKEQIKKPFKNMPPFAGRLNENELDQILVYLKTL